MKAFFGYIAGLLFGVGLGLGGMTDPARVLGFLDIFGAWDPTLLFVLGGAVITTFIGYRVVLRQAKPLRGKSFRLPTRHDLDGKLVVGAALFGTGWGLSGYCPGPAFASIGNPSYPLIAMLLAMIAGWWVARRSPFVQ
ncbi:DUF6691 family protein [Marinobacter sp.]|uniref:DUF6691 family protein n=1 Tax=Marinobacter sp. TaxID=50741 RepID=UPI0026077BF8|nr:DUF6691 family protein [Marinobacter sp.]